MTPRLPRIMTGILLATALLTACSGENQGVPTATAPPGAAPPTATATVQGEIPAPAPTPTPGSTPTPAPGSASLPFRIGTPVDWQLDGVSLTINVTVAMRGYAARRAILAAGETDLLLPEGYEYALVRVIVSYTGEDAGPISLTPADWRSLSNGSVTAWEDHPVCCLSPEFDMTLTPGGGSEGWVALPVAVDDPAPVIGLGGDAGVHFELASERLTRTDVLYEDDFSSDLSGWQKIYRDETGISDYDMGGFRLQVLEDHFDYWANPNLDFTDVIIEVEAARIGGPEDNDYGLICRYMGPEAAANFYFFIVSSDGYYGIGKYVEGEQFLIGSDLMLRTDLVLPGEQANHLRAECIGETLRLYINGTLQHEVTDPDFTHGDVGLIAGSFEEPGTDILFDNFAVLEP